MRGRKRMSKTWPIAAAVSAAAAALSAAVAVLSVSGGNTVLTAISAASAGLFAACAATAWIIHIKISKAEDVREEINCLRLKKAGIERRCDEIVPKGKMPNE